MCIRDSRSDHVGADKLAKGLDVIQRNAKAQARLVDDILDVSRIVSGKLVLDPRPTGLALVVSEARTASRASDTTSAPTTRSPSRGIPSGSARSCGTCCPTR